MPKEPRGCICPLFTGRNGQRVNADLSLLCAVVVGKELDKLKSNEHFANRMASSNNRKSIFRNIKNKFTLLEHYQKTAKPASFENLSWFEQAYGVSITLWFKSQNDITKIYDGCGNGVKIDLLTQDRNSLR